MAELKWEESIVNILLLLLLFIFCFFEVALFWSLSDTRSCNEGKRVKSIARQEGRWMVGEGGCSLCAQKESFNGVYLVCTTQQHSLYNRKEYKTGYNAYKFNFSPHVMVPKRQCLVLKANQPSETHYCCLYDKCI